jgi:hypothetical protein
MAEQPEGQNPLENMLDKIKELIQLAQQNASKELDAEHLPSDIEKQLLMVEKEVEKFKKISDQIVELSGTPEEEIKKILSGDSIPPDLPPDAKRLLNRTEQLAFEAKSLGGIAQDGMLSDPRSKQKKKSVSGKERRKKFKRFGSDDNWKPL